MTSATEQIVLATAALLAGAVNGGLGYGFSSITVPVALLFRANRVVNPALVLIEVPINLVSLFVHRRALPAIFARALPLLAGAVPGVLAGSLLLAHVAQGALKIATFALLLPLLLLQSAGLRRPFRRERSRAFPAGVALGALYGATTISGPPLALLFNNQGLSKDEFRAAIALFRVVESTFTLATYLALGFVTLPSLGISSLLLPGAILGVPLGALALRKVPAEPFRRICMAADALLVAFGLSRSLAAEHLFSAAAAWALFAAIAGVEAVLLAGSLLGRLRPPLAAAGAQR